MESGFFSPEFDARFCYLIVMLAGMLTAVREVDTRLAKIPGAWSDPGAHRLFAFLWLTPVVLFFLLDRSGAINDTSPVAALVVAVSYGAILSASSGEGTIAQSLKGLWSKLLGDMDKLSANMQARMQLRNFEYRRRMIEEIAGRKESFERLRALAQRLVDDPGKLDEALTAIDVQYPTDSGLATWKKTEHLIGALNRVYVSRRLPDEVHDLLREERLIGWRTYARVPGEQVGGLWRNLSVLVPATLIVALALASTTDYAHLERGWLHWRLSKSNVTASDLTRTREALIERVVRSPIPAEELYVLAASIREATAPARIDGIIGVMTDGVRERADREKVTPDLIVALILSLRTASIEGRGRVNAALVYLADARLKSIAENKDALATLDRLRRWVPSEKDTVTDLAARTDDWQRFFSMAK
jgi:hypothetical protein